MSTHTTKLVQMCLAIPAPLKAWLDVSAQAHGMSRNAFIGFLLQVARQTAERQKQERRMDGAFGFSSGIIVCGNHGNVVFRREGSKQPRYAFAPRAGEKLWFKTFKEANKAFVDASGVAEIRKPVTAYLDAEGWSLSDEHGNEIEEWPDDWPKIVDSDFLRSRGVNPVTT